MRGETGTFRKAAAVGVLALAATTVSMPVASAADVRGRAVCVKALEKVQTLNKKALEADGHGKPRTAFDYNRKTGTAIRDAQHRDCRGIRDEGEVRHRLDYIAADVKKAEEHNFHGRARKAMPYEEDAWGGIRKVLSIVTH
ncbi:hypothetical protein ACWC2K_03495 [Streptomyces chattanoogensis]|uniref:hypothetical protein n=1 Tax=Streptomyces chattanoogensis TaxID=66876 RepID=UPI0036BB7EB2